MESFKVFINFKTYPQGTGEKAVELVRELGRVDQPCLPAGRLTKGNDGSRQARTINIEIIPIVQVVDLWRIKQETKLPIWVQQVDWQPQGKFNGWTNLEAVVEAGARGTLINHSEHSVPPGTVKQILARAGARDREESERKFEIMVCARTLGQVERLVKLKPDYMAYEIAELIGTETSITATNPKAIEHAVKICGSVPLIVGAGVNSAEDLAIARKLGAKGVLISSAVVLAKDPKRKIVELIGLK